MLKTEPIFSDMITLELLESCVHCKIPNIEHDQIKNEMNRVTITGDYFVLHATHTEMTW